MDMTTQAQLNIARWSVPTLKSGIIFSLVAKALRARRVRRERQLLPTLSERMLKDIGISRADAQREASRSGWDCKRIDRLSL